MAEKENKTPLKRKVISLRTKIEILNRLEKSQSATEIGRSLGLNEATIRTIKKNETKIRRAADIGTSISTKFTNRARAPILEKMEKALAIWIDDSYKKKVPLSQRIIQEEALRIYEVLKQNGEPSSSTDFLASNGWFEKFKKRFSIHNLKIKGETASADDGAASTYRQEILGFIEEEESWAEQVFNADETMLCWKKIPSRTFLSKNEKVAAPTFKAQKDRFSLLRCSNATGDFQVKPMLVYRSLNPRALKGASNSKTDDNSSEETEHINVLTLEKLQEIIALASSLKSSVVNSDPLIKRRLKFTRQLEKTLLPYQECYKEAIKANKQSKITDFFAKKEEPPQKKTR